MPAQFSIEKLSRGKPGWKRSVNRRCHECWKIMRPQVRWREARPGDEEGAFRYGKWMVVDCVLHYGYGKEGYFCTLKCAYSFACKHVS